MTSSRPRRPNNAQGANRSATERTGNDVTTPATTLAITLGDPRGIGPEIVAKALADPRVLSLDMRPIVIGPAGTPVNVDECIGQ